MPPVTLHMVLARSIAQDLAHADLETSAGPYLLGATTPDIRVLTREPRSRLHFFDLDGPDHQDSVGGFLAAHGRYAAPEHLSQETRAWVGGYLTHLALDEQYITGVYRPFFARHEELGGRIRANVMDRLLQFDLDRKLGGDPELKRDLVAALSCTVENIDVAGVIEVETLERWRQVTSDIAARTLDWDRMRAMISNHLRVSGIEDGGTLAAFLDELPSLLDETIGYVTNTEIASFLERSTAAARKVLERYLECG